MDAPGIEPHQIIIFFLAGFSAAGFRPRRGRENGQGLPSIGIEPLDAQRVYRPRIDSVDTLLAEQPCKTLRVAGALRHEKDPVEKQRARVLHAPGVTQEEDGVARRSVLFEKCNACGIVVLVFQDPVL